MVELHGAMQAIGYDLLVLFLAMSIFSATMNLSGLKHPETALKYFPCFAAAKAAVTYGLDLMTAAFSICSGIVDTSASAVTQVWSYVGETIFNMLILVGLVKGSDRIIKEMMGL